jgi:hypothetical protein
MPDPNDPRRAALQNITQSSRAYGRDRRRGDDASTDPAFRAALEMQDPEARRAALAEYARGRAQGMFAQPQAAPMPNGGDVVAQAFPDDNAFADVQRNAAPLPSQADVMGQMGVPSKLPAGKSMAFKVPDALGAGPPTPRQVPIQPPQSNARADEAEAKMAQEAAMMADRVRMYGGPNGMSDYQSGEMPGAEDSPETHQWLMNRGRQITAPNQAQVDADYADEAAEARDTARIENRITARRRR